MAEASLISIAESLLTKLGPYASKKVISCWEAKDDLQKLVSTIAFIKAGLLDAEKRQNEGELIKLWLQRLRNVLYDADDLFDKVFTIVESKQILTGKEKLLGELSQFFSKSNHIALRAEIARKVKQIREELDGIKSDMDNFAFNRNLSENEMYCERESSSVKAVDEIIGREEDEKILKGLLMDAASKEEGSADVIVIVGFGGLGKTTLAQLLYNNKVVKAEFELRAWACISDIKGATTKARIILDALQTAGTAGSSERSSNPKNVEGVSVDRMELEIQTKVRNKKYLLVLDDFWDEDHSTWLHLKGLLRGGETGSKILVTTRSSDVALAMGIESPYYIKGLADDKAWELFKTLAFRSRADAMDQELVSMGKEIVRKCKNVPIAIKAIASLLYVCQDKKKTWREVMESDMLTLEKHHNLNILPVLKLSYDHLPSHLKHCFAFCSVFPKDFKMIGEELIFYWISHGYVERDSHGGQYGLMQIGETYLNELVSRSFLQDTDFEFHYKMHDLMHDLAQEVAGKELLRVEGVTRSINWLDVTEHVGKTKRNNHVFGDARVRHLSLFGDKGGYDFLPLKRAEYVRSLISHDLKILRIDFKMFCNLRLLGLPNIRIESLCSSIGELVHLRCLIMSRNRFKHLPDEICKLHNLKVLDLRLCNNLERLPRDLNKLINLACLRVNCTELGGMPRKFGALSSLESLDHFIVGKSSSVYCGVEALARLVNFRDEELVVEFKQVGGGSLRKDDDQNRVDLSSSLLHLDHMQITWPRNDFRDYEASEWGREGVEFQCSQLPPNLKRLDIRHFRGKMFPKWNVFNSLYVVKLYQCSCRYLPSFGQQPGVKRLKLSYMLKLEYVQMEDDDEFVAETRFPCLEKLQLEGLQALKAWSPAMEKLAHRYNSSPTPVVAAAFPIFPSLTSLGIINCPQLMSIPLPPKGRSTKLNLRGVIEPLNSLLAN